jgi:small-conductance mechanosensitive channel
MLATGALILTAGLALPSPLVAQSSSAPEAARSDADASETAPNAPPSEAAAPQPPVVPRATRRAREASLVAILSARRQAESDLRALQTELRSDAAKGREAELERQVRARASDLERLSRSFSELATGVDPLSLEAETEQPPFELGREVRILLSPLINELKRATSRPREIDRLRTEVADLEGQLKTIDKALARLDTVSGATKDEPLLKALASERKDWTVRRSALDATLDVTAQKLDQQTAESRSLAETVHEVFGLFFKSRGRNLVLAVVAMVTFLVVLRRLRTFLGKRPGFVQRGQTFHGRVFGLVYSVFSVVGAVLVFVLALYFFGDWVLLILALLLILGLVWASKQALPRFWSQAVLILDMGAVREGQRVIWNGLPWRVESIGFYCVLANPALVGGHVRIPIEDLASLRSRPTEDGEPWFPTKTGDVVLLESGRSAVVELQSTEIVRLQAPGGNRLSMPTAEFASKTLEVLSHGYRVDLEFGLDYENQSEITTTDRDLMQTEVERRWRASRWAASLVGVAVEFSKAGPSSLDYFIRVDLDGSQANEYAPQRRHLARICVDVCNENGWVIPFQQLTVHVARPDEA